MVNIYIASASARDLDRSGSGYRSIRARVIMIMHFQNLNLWGRSCMIMIMHDAYALIIRLQKTLWVWGPLATSVLAGGSFSLSPPKESQTLSRGPYLCARARGSLYGVPAATDEHAVRQAVAWSQICR